MATESTSAKATKAAVSPQNGERLNKRPSTTATSAPKQQSTKVTNMIDIADCRHGKNYAWHTEIADENRRLHSKPPSRVNECYGDVTTIDARKQQRAGENLRTTSSAGTPTRQPLLLRHQRF